MNIVSAGSDQLSDQLPTRGLQEVCLDDTEAALPDCDQDIARPLPGIGDLWRQIFECLFAPKIAVRLCL